VHAQESAGLDPAGGELSDLAREIIDAMRPMVHISYNMVKSTGPASDMVDAGINGFVKGFLRNFGSVVPKDELLAGAFCSLCELVLRTRKSEIYAERIAGVQDGEMRVQDRISQQLRSWGALEIAQRAFYSCLMMLSQVSRAK